MKVYVLFESKYEHSPAEIVDIFETKEKAEEAESKSKYRCYIKEYEVK